LVEAQAFLSTMGNKFTNCEAVGNAQKYKICNNMAAGIEMASVCEALY